MEEVENVVEYVVVGKIGLRTLLRAAVRGGALYLYVPKQIVEAYGLMGGDQVEASLGEVRRRESLVKEAEKDEA